MCRRSGSQKESLFGAIDHTKTVVGARLLRSSILRPSTGAVFLFNMRTTQRSDLSCCPAVIDIPTIATRLDTVELFLR
jgi:hypothetical protein